MLYNLFLYEEILKFSLYMNVKFYIICLKNKS